MTEAAPLKPCPLCGKPDPEIDGKSESVRLRCAGCGMLGPIFFFESDDDDGIELAESAAIGGWNRRAPQAEPVAWAKFDSDGNCLAWQVGANRQSAELDTPLYAGHAPEPQEEQAAEGKRHG